MKSESGISPGLLTEIGDDEQDDMVLVSQEDLSAKSEEALSIELKDALLETRGGHELRFKWVFPAFVRLIDTNSERRCEEVQKLSTISVSGSSDPGVLYYEKAKAKAKAKTEPRCKIILNASIAKGKKKTFSINPCVVEFSLDQKEIDADEVDGALLLNICQTYYCPGYRAEMLTIAL